MQIIYIFPLNPDTPVAQKVADEVVFRRLQSEGVEFFISDLTDPPFRFCLFKKNNLSPSSFNFSVGFISRSPFEPDGFIAYSNE